MIASRTPTPNEPIVSRHLDAARRRFLHLGAGLGGSLLLGCGAEAEGDRAGRDTGGGTPGRDAGSDAGSDAAVDGSPNGGVDADSDLASDIAADTAAATSFRFAVITDTHVIDEWYTGPENSPLDTESMQFANARMDAVIDRINGLETPVDLVIHVGDLVHTLANCRDTCDLDFQYANRTSIDIAAEKLARLRVPYQLCWGNHDYEFESVDREDCHDLFAAKLGPVMPRYGVLEHAGWKFVTLNSYLGATHANRQDQMNGSLGEEQLLWLEAQLQEGKPTMIFLHQMLQIMEQQEVRDFGLHGLLRQYRDVIPWVIAGHTHRWLPFGRQYGPEHMVIGATRYDEDCFVVGEIDPVGGAVTLLNESTWERLTPFASRWEER